MTRLTPALSAIRSGQAAVADVTLECISKHMQVSVQWERVNRRLMIFVLEIQVRSLCPAQ